MDYIIGFNDTLNSLLQDGLHTIIFPKPSNSLPFPRICIQCPQLSNQGNIKSNVN